MPVTVVLLVLASALAHAAWNAILKRCRDSEAAIVPMMTIASVTALGVAAVLRVAWPSRTSLAWIVATGVLEAGYFVTLSRALARSPLGSVYTIVRGGALVIVWPISVIFLEEKITVSRAVGSVVVALGLAATGFRSNDKTEEKRTVRSGLVIAAVCAVFVGGYHLTYKVALADGAAPSVVSSFSLSIASAISIIMLDTKTRPRALAAIRDQPLRLVVGGILGAMGFLLFLSAMKTAGAGLVLTLRNTSILFAQLMAVALGERPSRLSMIGAVLVTAGAALLTYS